MGNNSQGSQRSAHQSHLLNLPNKGSVNGGANDEVEDEKGRKNSASKTYGRVLEYLNTLRESGPAADASENEEEVPLPEQESQRLLDKKSWLPTRH